MTSIHVIQSIILAALILLLLYGYTKEVRIAAWERKQARKILRRFRKTRLCLEINRMLRRMKMAHQEVRR